VAPSERLQIEYTAKPVSDWGGVLALVRYFDFNLVALFKRDVTRNERPQLSTLRARLLVAGAILGGRGGRPVLRLGLIGRLQARFVALPDRVTALPHPAAAQLGTGAETPDFSLPTRWRARKSQTVFPRLQLRFN
jgi:hypothetical protein